MDPVQVRDREHEARVDWLMILYLATVASIVVVFRGGVPGWGLFVLLHVATIAILVRLVFMRQEPADRVLRFLSYWYPAFCLLPLFVELSFLIHLVHPTDYDRSLELLDRQWFGVDPVAWLQRSASPWLTDALQLAYASFYLFPLWLLLALYLSKRLRDFRKAQFGMLLCFFLSYIGYFLVPALGPRFFSHEAPQGSLISRFIQEMLNHFERAGSMRDAFPSGHAAVAVMVQWYAFRFFRLRGFWLLPLTAALIFSTVYLAYHYAVDVLAGIALGLTCLALSSWIEARISRMTDSEPQT